MCGLLSYERTKSPFSRTRLKQCVVIIGVIANTSYDRYFIPRTLSRFPIVQFQVSYSVPRSFLPGSE